MICLDMLIIDLLIYPRILWNFWKYWGLGILNVYSDYSKTAISQFWNSLRRSVTDDNTRVGTFLADHERIVRRRRILLKKSLIDELNFVEYQYTFQPCIRQKIFPGIWRCNAADCNSNRCSGNRRGGLRKVSFRKECRPSQPLKYCLHFGRCNWERPRRWRQSTCSNWLHLVDNSWHPAGLASPVWPAWSVPATNL